VKLLLDEQISPAEAEALRRRGHDVVAVGEHRDLLSSTDLDVLVGAAAEGRAVVSENIRDFVRLGAHRLPSRQWHHGIVLVSGRGFPGSRDGFGVLIRALDALLAAHPGDDDLVGEVVWLKRAPDDLVAE
jgi:hypothetical protein